jgi:hypothetical protein
VPTSVAEALSIHIREQLKTLSCSGISIILRTQ